MSLSKTLCPLAPMLPFEVEVWGLALIVSNGRLSFPYLRSFGSQDPPGIGF